MMLIHHDPQVLTARWLSTVLGAIYPALQSGLEKVGGTCWGQQIVQRVLDTSWGLQQWVVSSHRIFTPLSSRKLKQPQQPGTKKYRCFRKISAVSSQPHTSPASSLLPTNTFPRASCPPPCAVRGREKINTFFAFDFLYISIIFLLFRLLRRVSKWPEQRQKHTGCWQQGCCHGDRGGNPGVWKLAGR